MGKNNVKGITSVNVCVWVGSVEVWLAILNRLVRVDLIEVVTLEQMLQ